MSQILCLWSGPRNISTAMMRSFGARVDTNCWDEPFFAPFLKQTGLPHPGRDETLQACETHPEKVTARILAPIDAPYHFQKHMAHHMLPSFPMGWVTQARHVLLLRHPARVIVSYAKGRPSFTASDLGFATLRNLHQTLSDMIGTAPLVMDSQTILSDPETALRRICERGFDIPFDPAMLRWKAGPRPEDGPWAPYWYDSVNASTGFGLPYGPLPTVPAQYSEIYESCLQDYEALRVLT